MATNIGTGPQDIPLNQFLGEMAFMDNIIENGEWIPTMNKSGDTGSVTGSVIAYGRYVKIGPLLWISFYFYKSSGSFGALSNQWYVGNLPYPVYPGPSGGYQFIPAGYWTINGAFYDTNGNSNRWQANGTNGNNTITLYGPGSTTNWTSGYIEAGGSGVLMISPT